MTNLSFFILISFKFFFATCNWKESSKKTKGRRKSLKSPDLFQAKRTLIFLIVWAEVLGNQQRFLHNKQQVFTFSHNVNCEFRHEHCKDIGA